MRKLLLKITNSRDANSLAHKWRTQRFQLFKNEVLDKFSDQEIRILDLGGTTSFWEKMKIAGNDKITVFCLNLTGFEENHNNIKSVIGDARDLSQYKDKQFDIVFSNSVIEHVGGYSDQQSMANEIRRVGKTYFVQTPNYYFPLEPHFLFPFFQFLPKSIRVLLHRNMNLGNFRKQSNKEVAKRNVEEITLLKQNELRRLFPDGAIHKEKIFGLNKSFMVINR